MDITPTMFNYKLMQMLILCLILHLHSIYIAKLVFSWLKEQGGILAMEKRNKEKQRYYMII